MKRFVILFEGNDKIYYHGVIIAKDTDEAFSKGNDLQIELNEKRIIPDLIGFWLYVEGTPAWDELPQKWRQQAEEVSI